MGPRVCLMFAGPLKLTEKGAIRLKATPLARDEKVDVHQCGERNKVKAVLATKLLSPSLRHPSNSCVPATRIAKENGIKASISYVRR
ncbi:hypothetical protein AVEN_54585-1 [Araneus ventricosus]|uniref:Uncharacterized protein n=1 Tax=Araneus ventricosus TaxID=182803 RepID=A0A4Y2BL41_ARAVE|nr:hypothetical protein AVEN_54585-1 [Araneus ventricosus]